MIQALSITVFLAVFALLAYGCSDAESAAVTAAHVAESDERKAVAPELGFPLIYDASVTMSGPDGIKRTRFYSRSKHAGE